MSRRAVESYPERIVPDETEPGVVAIHLKRYDFARPHCKDKRVLDAACGVGYGTAYLAEAAAHVTGVDLDKDALGYARARYARANVDFVRADVTALPFDAGSFDVVCSFETIEHVGEPPAALDEFARVLRPEGTLVLSTPRVSQTRRDSPNPHHRVELDREDLQRLLEERFAEVEILGQRRVETARHRLARNLDVFGLRRRLPVLQRGAAILGSAPTSALTLDDIEISHSALARATELIAVCRIPAGADAPLHSTS